MVGETFFERYLPEPLHAGVVGGNGEGKRVVELEGEVTQGEVKEGEVSEMEVTKAKGEGEIELVEPEKIRRHILCAGAFSSLLYLPLSSFLCLFVSFFRNNFAGVFAIYGDFMLMFELSNAGGIGFY